MTREKMTALMERDHVHQPNGSSDGCPVCVPVWRYLESIPGFSEQLRQAEAELEAGGGIDLDDLEP